jgi:hypothetical protein
MVSCGEDHVFHTASVGDSRPRVGVKVLRMELICQLCVLVGRNLLNPLHPLAAARDGADTPMDEHPKSRLTPPGNSLGSIGVRNHRRRLRIQQMGAK